MTAPCPLHLLEVEDARDYRDQNPNILNWALNMIEQHQVMAQIVPGRGAARFLNLVHFNFEAPLEYVDGPTVFADQMIHLATHLRFNQDVSARTKAGLLAGEAVASAMDMLNLAHFIEIGMESDFLINTLESVSYYFDCYGDQGSYQSWLLGLKVNPFQTFKDVLLFLFDWSACLAHEKPQIARLSELQKSLHYPLAHHFNVANWILFSKTFPSQRDEDTRQKLEVWTKSHTAFRDWMGF